MALRNIARWYRERLYLLGDLLTDCGMRLAIEPVAGFYTLWETPTRAFGEPAENSEVFNLMMIDKGGGGGVYESCGSGGIKMFHHVSAEDAAELVRVGGQELEGVKLEAELFFPARIKQALGDWRVGLPVLLGDREAVPVQGTTAGGSVATLSFDEETGLLLRLTRYAESPVAESGAAKSAPASSVAIIWQRTFMACANLKSRRPYPSVYDCSSIHSLYPKYCIATTVMSSGCCVRPENDATSENIASTISPAPWVRVRSHKIPNGPFLPSIIKGCQPESISVWWWKRALPLQLTRVLLTANRGSVRSVQASSKHLWLVLSRR